jgi:predicted dehydrogenase
VKVILVGNGYFGSLYRERLSESTQYTLTGVVDFDPSRLPTGPYVTATSLDDILRHVEADAVVIATPPNTHKTLCVRALEAGLHVFCAKPAGLSMSECFYIHGVAQRNDKAFYVDYTMLASPESNTIAQQVEILGDAVLMTSIRHVVTPPKPEGIIWDLACHDVATFYTYCDYDRITSVVCKLSDNTMLAELHDGKKVVGLINAACNARTPNKTVTLRIAPRKPISTQQLSLVWDQNARNVSINAQGKGVSIEFAKNPDPISLSLARFKREAHSAYMNRFSIDLHQWVTMVLDALEKSAKANGETIMVRA